MLHEAKKNGSKWYVRTGIDVCVSVHNSKSKGCIRYDVGWAVVVVVLAHLKFGIAYMKQKKNTHHQQST